MQKILTIIPFVVLWLHPLPGMLQEQSETPGLKTVIRETMNWHPVEFTETAPGQRQPVLRFDGSIESGRYGQLPLYHYRTALAGSGGVSAEATLQTATWEPVSPAEWLAIESAGTFTDNPAPVALITTERKRPYLEITLYPFRRNAGNGMVEKLTSFELHYTITPSVRVPSASVSSGYVAHSVLASGSWYKFAMSQTGIHLLTYNDLTVSDINPSAIDPRTIRIFCNGGGMLPESNQEPRIDDLRELSILVSGEEDGRFDPGDYILFYGEDQVVWSLSSSEGFFRHQKNIYADQTFCFLTFGGLPGKRITTETSSTLPASQTITRFNDYQLYEKDDINLIKSGREWFDGEYFDVTLARNYTFAFPNLDLSEPVKVTARVAARSTSGSSSFSIAVNGLTPVTVSIPQVSGDFLATYAREKTAEQSILTSKTSFDIQVKFSRPNSSAIGWLNYLTVNGIRNLILSGSQMGFRSVASIGPGAVSQFNLTTQGQPVQIWDVTDPGSIRRIQADCSGTDCSFRVSTTTLREFIAFDGSGYFKPEYAGQVPNQDLHGSGPFDYVMVSHPAFLHQAEQLAQFHRAKNGYRVFITTPQTVFNEFSSGAQDLSAIRDFIRMLYTKASPGDEPKFLLLFGDASYDYKDREEGNTNLVLAYQSPESLDPLDSYVTDDYFALLDSTEGQGTGGSLDIGVGRLPVATETEATEAIAKILHYCSNSDSVKNDWRNVLCFVADDGDGNLHMNQVEDLTNQITAQNPVYNIDKIYLDAYQQISTPGGQRCPEVNDAINKRVDKGALIINYTGHGGELGWAHERVLEVPDIQSWTNFDRMPVFVTATCEFSRYDDPERISAGEWVFLNPRGGGIALFTTTRPTFAGSNFALATSFYSLVFTRTSGEYLHMGDLIMQAKNNTSSSANTRKFVLLGDPALQLAYPNQQVMTTSVSSDTLKALSEVTITGEVTGLNGLRDEGFNGYVFPTVYDKPSEIMTLGNDGDPPIEFLSQKNQIYKGQVQVQNGTFQFTFIVPKDIAYNFGDGKISYYARSPETDAHGFDGTIIVGGYNMQAIVDDQGPDITLYMNTTSFISGGVTNQNPILLAFIADESGINTVGNGIGHDITAVLDSDSRKPQILNDYYVSDLDTYQSGQIAYPFFNLAEGYHTITLKVWDVFNNSSEATIGFTVVNSGTLVLEELFNYPNPFQDKTKFSFETNQSDVAVEVEIRIYTLYGRLVKTIRQTVYSNGYRLEPVSWDGTADGGWKVCSGTYPYRVTLTLPDGSFARATSKMVVIR